MEASGDARGLFDLERRATEGTPPRTRLAHPARVAVSSGPPANEPLMPKFLVLYRSNTPATEQMAAGTPEEMQARMDAWMARAGRVGTSLSDMGSPLGDARSIGDWAPSPGHIGWYSILEADGLDAAMTLVDGHPHLITPGGATVEVHELLPMPGM